MAWTILEQGNEYNVFSNYREYLIDDATDLENPPDPADYAPGSIAHTPGFKKIYEADTQGNWVEIGV